MKKNFIRILFVSSALVSLAGCDKLPSDFNVQVSGNLAANPPAPSDHFPDNQEPDNQEPDNQEPVNQDPVNQPPADTPTDTTSLVDLNWNPPTDREDGNALYPYEIGGYEIKYRNIDDTEYTHVTLNVAPRELPPEHTSVEVPESGTYEFSIAIFDTSGLYSPYSDAVTLMVE